MLAGSAQPGLSPRRGRVPWHPAGSLPPSVVLLLVLVCAGLALESLVAAPPAHRAIEAGELFNLTNLWTVHLSFTPDQWEAMEPKGGPGPFGGPPGGGPFGGRGGSGAGPRVPPQDGPGGFGPAMFLAPLFLSQGDLNHHGRLSRSEFEALARKWFAAWDTNKTGKLDAAKFRTGLNAILSPAGGPGRPGHRAGPVPGRRPESAADAYAGRTRRAGRTLCGHSGRGGGAVLLLEMDGTRPRACARISFRARS